MVFYKTSVQNKTNAVATVFALVVQLTITGCMSTKTISNLQPTPAYPQCPKTTIENHTLGWSKGDEINFQLAKKGCIKNYGPTACLMRFVKLNEHRYMAVCKKM